MKIASTAAYHKAQQLAETPSIINDDVKASVEAVPKTRAAIMNLGVDMLGMVFEKTPKASWGAISAVCTDFSKIIKEKNSKYKTARENFREFLGIPYDKRTLADFNKIFTSFAPLKKIYFDGNEVSLKMGALLCSHTISRTLFKRVMDDRPINVKAIQQIKDENLPDLSGMHDYVAYGPKIDTDSILEIFKRKEPLTSADGTQSTVWAEMAKTGLLTFAGGAKGTLAHVAADNQDRNMRGADPSVFIDPDPAVDLSTEEFKEFLRTLPSEAFTKPDYFDSRQRDHALLRALREGMPLEIIESLMECGPLEAINQADHNGVTALQLAAWRHPPETIRLLLENGAHESISQKTQSSFWAKGHRPFEKALDRASKDDNIEYIMPFLECAARKPEVYAAILNEKTFGELVGYGRVDFIDAFMRTCRDEDKPRFLTVMLKNVRHADKPGELINFILDNYVDNKFYNANLHLDASAFMPAYKWALKVGDKALEKRVSAAFEVSAS